MTVHALAPPPTASQAKALDAIRAALAAHRPVLIDGHAGSGRTLLLEALHSEAGGRLLRAQDAFRTFAEHDPAKMEEALIDLLAATHAEHNVILFDDLPLVSVPTMLADRPGYMDQLFQAYFKDAATAGKRIVLTGKARDAARFGTDVTAVEIGGFDAADYRAILEHHADRRLDTVDFDALHRAYRALSGTALAFLGRLIRAEAWPEVTADRLVSVADSYLSTNNLDLAEVANVDFDTLIGIESLVETLERTVLIPMTEPQLARELGLKPKRGILLHGEPGTGKTTVGRALARRMKGKFFMIDGTFMPDDQFYEKFYRVMTDAINSSPSVIFIDDADVLFRNGEMMGLARLLLSKLDGLESETQSHVCVVMTAMSIADMPPAMVRSGRVEVWIEMVLPDAERRITMIEHFARGLPEDLVRFDTTVIGQATVGFTPADVRGLVDDARGHLAYDRQRNVPASSFEAYLLLAAGEIAARKAVLRTMGN